MHRAVSILTQARPALRVLLNLAAVGCLLVASGCATDPLANQRVESYTPQVQSSDRMPWKAGAPSGVEAVSPVGEGMSDGQSRDLPPIISSEDTTAPGTTSSPGQQVRMLRRDDHLMVSMRGIPRPEEVADVIDNDGNITLPLVGSIHVEGITTSEAESAIERAYVRGGYYQKIDVIVVAQEDSFFVRGEVTRPGKYQLAGETTLMMAITAAGGYTDFANPRKIRVVRGDEVLPLNGSRIEARQDEDCIIEPNDIIVVERKIFL